MPRSDYRGIPGQPTLLTTTPFSQNNVPAASIDKHVEKSLFVDLATYRIRDRKTPRGCKVNHPRQPPKRLLAVAIFHIGKDNLTDPTHSRDVSECVTSSGDLN